MIINSLQSNRTLRARSNIYHHMLLVDYMSMFNTGISLILSMPVQTQPADTWTQRVPTHVITRYWMLSTITPADMPRGYTDTHNQATK